MTVNRCGHVVWWRVGKLQRQAHNSAHLSKRHQDLEGGVHKEVGRLDNECEHGQVVQATLVLDRKENDDSKPSQEHRQPANQCIVMQKPVHVEEKCALI